MRVLNKFIINFSLQKNVGNFVQKMQNLFFLLLCLSP